MGLITLNILLLILKNISALNYSCGFDNFQICTTVLNPNWTFVDGIKNTYEKIVSNRKPNDFIDYPKGHPLCISDDPHATLVINVPKISEPDNLPHRLCFSMIFSFKSATHSFSNIPFLAQSMTVSVQNYFSQKLQATAKVSDKEKFDPPPSYSLSLSEIFINQENVPLGPAQDSKGSFTFSFEINSLSDLTIEINATLGSCIHEYRIFDEYPITDDDTKCPIEMTFPIDDAKRYRLRYDDWNRMILLNGRQVYHNIAKETDPVKGYMRVSTWRFGLNNLVFTCLGLIFGLLFIFILTLSIVLSKRSSKKAILQKRMEILRRPPVVDSGDSGSISPSAPPPPSATNSLNSTRRRDENTFTIISNHLRQPVECAIETRQTSAHNSNQAVDKSFTTQQSLNQLASAIKQQEKHGRNYHKKAQPTSSDEMNQHTLDSTTSSTSNQSNVIIGNASRLSSDLQRTKRPKNSVNNIIQQHANRQSLLLTMNELNEIVLQPNITRDEGNNGPMQIEEVDGETYAISDNHSDQASFREDHFNLDADSKGPPPDYNEAVFVPSSCKYLKKDNQNLL